jgi:phage major head subunit gpT-like protein
MAVINSSSLQAIATGYSKRFNTLMMELEKVPTLYSKLATVVKTPNTKIVNFPYLSDLADMSEWTGSRQITDITYDEFTISAKSYELTLGIDRDDILYDNLGLLSPKFDDMVRKAYMHRDKVLMDLLYNGTTTNAYDGDPIFIDTATKSGGLNGSRDVNLDSLDLNEANLESVVTSMELQRTDDGNLSNIYPTTLIVSPSQRANAEKLINLPYQTGGANNPFYNKFELIVTPHMRNDDWLLFDGSKSFKGFIMMETQNERLQKMFSPNDESVFMDKTYRIGVDSIFGVAGGNPRLMFLNQP